MINYTASTRAGSSQRVDIITRRYIDLADESTKHAGEPSSSSASSSSLIPISTIVTTARPSKRRQLLNLFTARDSHAALSSFAALPSFDRPPTTYESSDVVSMAPSPHTRPLLSRPIAREEAIHGCLQVAIAKGVKPKPSMSQFATARREAEVLRIAKHEPLPVCTSTVSDEAQQRFITARDIYTTILRDRELCAMNAAAESRYIREWGFFLKCYAEVRYAEAPFSQIVRLRTQSRAATTFPHPRTHRHAAPRLPTSQRRLLPTKSID